MMRKEKNEKRVPFADVAKGIDQGLEAADPQRLAGLQRLQRVRAVKATSLQREEARLSQKLGANHPRVVMLKNKREANAELENQLSWGVGRAQTPAVKSDPVAWTLHGHVRNRALTGLPNLTVALYDEKNQHVEELGSACTDRNGYFKLTVKPTSSYTGTVKDSTDIKGAQETKENQAPAAMTKSQLRDAAGAETTAPRTGLNQYDNTRRGFYIHVTDNQTATLYVSTEALRPKLGEVVYREIILDGDGCECVPPGGKPRDGETEPTTGRYLGNRRNFELHDTNNLKPSCQVDEIRENQRQFFTSQKDARAAGYDFCAYCFGKEKSKR